MLRSYPYMIVLPHGPLARDTLFQPSAVTLPLARDDWRCFVDLLLHLNVDGDPEGH